MTPNELQLVTYAVCLGILMGLTLSIPIFYAWRAIEQMLETVVVWVMRGTVSAVKTLRRKRT